MIDILHVIRAVASGAATLPPPNAPGIYAIINRQDEKAYIGQTNDLARRWLAHRAALEAGGHHCAALQEDWKTLGAERFAYWVIEAMPRARDAELNAAEVGYIGQVIGTAYCYNVNAAATGRPRTGRTPDNERLAKSKQALLESGGRRLTVNLAAESAQAIETIKTAEGFETDREAIEHALQHTADLVRRRERLTRRK